MGKSASGMHMLRRGLKRLKMSKDAGCYEVATNPPARHADCIIGVRIMALMLGMGLFLERKGVIWCTIEM